MTERGRALDVTEGWALGVAGRGACAGCGESLAMPERGRALDVAEGWALDVAGRGMRWLWRALARGGH